MHTDPTYEGLCLLDSKPSHHGRVIDNPCLIADRLWRRVFKFLTCQLSMVGYWPTMAVTGNRELGFDSGEGA